VDRAQGLPVEEIDERKLGKERCRSRAYERILYLWLTPKCRYGVKPCKILVFSFFFLSSSLWLWYFFYNAILKSMIGMVLFGSQRTDTEAIE